MVDYSCILSAFCFLISNALGVALIVLNMSSSKPHWDLELWKSLDPTYIQQEWDYRRLYAPLLQTANVFNAFAWFFVAIPMLQLAWGLSKGGRRKVGVHAAIAVFALAGCFAELLSRLLVFGAWSSANWISKTFNLDFWLPDGLISGAEADGMGWRATELTYMITEGMILWIDAFEWIALFCMLTLLYFSIGTQPKEQRSLPIWWARMGLVIAFLSFIDFSADVLRLEDWPTFGIIAVISSLVNTVILLPLWLILLSCQLHKAMPEYSEATIDGWSPQVQSGAM